MRLNQPQVTTLLNSIETSFDPMSLERLLVERFGVHIFAVTSQLKRWGDQVLDVHRHFDQRNTTEMLVAALRDFRPAVPEFVALADEMGFARLPQSSALEALVRLGEPYEDVMAFRTALAKREDAVCRVHWGDHFGTGTLIGKRMVITNHHVVAGAIAADGSLKSKVTCMFDFKKSGGTYITPAKRIEVTRVLAASTHAPQDLDSDGNNTDPAKLDYAILELSRDVADEPIVPGGEPRGYVEIEGALAPLAAQGAVLVLQHPQAQPMKIDLGSVTWIGATRMRHNVNTEGGSSGAPVFDARLRLVAIHHAGYDWPNATYPHNQAVPLSLIVANAKGHNINL